MLKNFMLASLLVVTSSVIAGECNSLYPKNQPIAVKNTVELCNRFYVSVYDKSHNAVILTSELLKKDSQVGSIKRINSFRSDGRVGNAVSNATYLASGYDKGHMTPADDASTPAEMRETFVLSNMTPQEPTLNRVAWKQLEERVRLIWQHSTNDVYVVTIAEYNKPELLRDTVPVPSGYWKIVFANKEQRWFYAKNKPYAKVEEVPPRSINSIVESKW